jgi:hypothetical protein
MGNCLDSSSAKVDSTQSSHNPGNITFAFCFSSFTVVASSSFLGFGLLFFSSSDSFSCYPQLLLAYRL